MSRRINGSLVVCVTAGMFTLGALLVDRSPGGRTPPPPAAVAESSAPVSGTARPASGTALSIEDFRFGPATARPGALVTVTNRDADAHTVTASDRSFDVRVGAAGSATFTAPSAPGTYTFVCALHPSMRGRLVVR